MFYVTFDQFLLSLIALLVVREVLYTFLPDTVIGPRGWLVRTGEGRQARHLP